MKRKIHTDLYFSKRKDLIGRKYTIEKEVYVYDFSRYNSDSRLWFYTKGKRGYFKL